MRRDLFGSVTDPSARGRVRNWPTVLLSFIAHAFALAMLLVIPLMASGALPVPKSGALVMAVLPPPLPVARPPLARSPRSRLRTRMSRRSMHQSASHRSLRSSPSSRTTRAWSRDRGRARTAH